MAEQAAGISQLLKTRRFSDIITLPEGILLQILLNEYLQVVLQEIPTEEIPELQAPAGLTAHHTAISLQGAQLDILRATTDLQIPGAAHLRAEAQVVLAHIHLVEAAVDQALEGQLLVVAQGRTHQVAAVGVDHQELHTQEEVARLVEDQEEGNKLL